VRALPRALLACAIAAAAPGQDSRPPAPPELRKAVEAYLAEKSEATAAKLLDELIRRPDATPDNVLSAVLEPPAAAPASGELLVPWKDQLLAATVRVPEGHARASAPLPVVFDIAGGDSSAHLALDRDAIVAFVAKYTPPEFSDEGRDGFLKVLRTAAFHARGDPGRLWLCGFSWAGHASWDVAIHRPGSVRGIVPMGGGPRRTWFRALAQVAPVRILSFCGQKDDQELVWNLREVEHLAPKLKLSYALTLDPDQGHTLPLKGIEGVAAIVRDTAAQDTAAPSSGTLLADAALVESPLLRIDGVDDRRVAVGPVPVDPTSSFDAQRRATIAGMASKVAKVSWKIDAKKDETIVTLTPDGVTAATVFLRATTFPPGRKITVRAGTKTVSSEPLLADARTVLAEARRTGERQQPALRRVEVRFQGR
jgi:pimeloyl-ACP methyl ester carboxylesterase